MISNSKNIAVGLETCVNNSCDENCGKDECQLCLNCVDSDTLLNMHRAYREHRNLGGFKRIFPSRLSAERNVKSSKNNQISINWFDKKCEENPDWC